MNIERLRNLVRALRECKEPDKFTMLSIMHPCGTPACAFGQYAFRTDLQDDFRLKPISSESWYPAVGVVDKRNHMVPYNCPRTRDHFDLHEEEIEELFDADGCGGAKTPNEAADYVEKFISLKALNEMVEENQAMGLYEELTNGS